MLVLKIKMTYDQKEFKLIHFDGIERISSLKDEYNAELRLGGDTFITQENKLPLKLSWRYRIFENGNVIFSLIAEGNYLLSFQKDENPLLDLLNLVDTSFLSFGDIWSEKVYGTPLQNFSLPAPNEHNHLEKAKEIMGNGIRQNLLNDNGYC